MIGMMTSVVRGVVAGAAATYAMKQVDAWLNERWNKQHEPQPQAEAEAEEEAMDDERELVERLVDIAPIELDRGEREIATYALSTGLGIGMSFVSSTMRRELNKRFGLIGGGLVFGMGVFLVMDELVKPLLDLADPPTAYPLKDHARGLLAHAAYGITENVIRGALTLR